MRWSPGLLRHGKPATLTVTSALHTEAVNIFFENRLSNYLTVGNQFFVTRQPFPLWHKSPTLPGAAKQLSDIEAQVKQLETSLAALRAAITTPHQPPAAGKQNE